MGEIPLSEEALKEMGLKPHEVKLFNTTIDMSGGPRSQRERHKPLLDQHLQAIDRGSLQDKIRAQREKIQDDYQEGSTESAERGESALVVLEALSSLMVLDDKQDVYNRLSKRKVWDIIDGFNELQGTDFADAAFQLKKVVERNAEADFPDELERQSNIRMKEEQDEIDEARAHMESITIR